jgi:glucose/arabinose dehydrogenase
MRRLGVVSGLLFVCAAPAAAQLQSHVVVSGFASPVAFVQDPALPDTQYVVEQGGRIRVVRGGQLAATDFLDLQSAISSGGERGLLGLAFAPDDGASGRFFVDFTNPNGDTVVARFRRSADDPRRADGSTRFDLQWPGGSRFILQPYANHNGGNLQFGPDGDLYIGLGDGGSGDDPENRAQTPSTLLGKMLRINVNVPDSDPEGYDIPPDNPFVGRAGYLAEIWAFGLRNPWRYSFDAYGTGATGALIIGDVGQDRFEEIDYEPAGRGGRNYGWRDREGAHSNVTSLPPAYLPLTDPTYDYSHSVGQTVIGGYVYRGSALPAAYRGQYFFADYVAGRVWSMTLSIGGTGEATAGTIQEHTAELGGSGALGNISSFGIDAAGELYLVSYSAGEIRQITSVSSLAMALDAPSDGATVGLSFQVGGWAIDQTAASGTGVDAVHLWAYPTSGAAPIFAGAASYGSTRSDVGAIYGSRFAPSGFGASVANLAAGSYDLRAFAHSSVTGAFSQQRTARITVAPPPSDPQMALDTPPPGATVLSSFFVGGWALDRGAPDGTGVDAVHVWAFPIGAGGSLGAATFLGVASYGSSRSDVGAAFGTRFTNSGFSLTASGLATGTYRLAVYAHSAVAGSFNAVRSADVTVAASTAMAIDAPTSGASRTQPFPVSGWAIDRAAAAGPGVDAINIWAFPASGSGGPFFAGAGGYGAARSDVGAAFGGQFTNSGYSTYVSGLATGTYDLIVYARSTVSGAFSQWRVVRVTIQ